MVCPILRHAVPLFRFLPGLCGILLHSQRVKPLGQLFPERLQLKHLGFLLTGLESGQCVKKKEQQRHPQQSRVYSTVRMSAYVLNFALCGSAFNPQNGAIREPHLCHELMF